MAHVDGQDAADRDENVDRHCRLIGEARRQAAAARSRSGAGPNGAGATDSSGAPALRSVQLPGYEVVREIHRGAQGVVYEAVQKSTERHVAVKVMREGPFAGAADRARFEREAQILARLDHPNVVTIHDSGVAAGCHYFVMDYVRGRSLDSHIASERPDLRATLELFAAICEAVDAAHIRGIIHRDLKPGNIRIDSAGGPHVLDFGLAKSVGEAPPGPDAHAPTITGQFIGSLPWASPEQAEGSSERIDVRTDVYALGVVLYQMLTERFPYPVVGPMGEVLGHIIRAEPLRPSVNVAPARGLRIDDEVDTIVLRCLAKDPARRYQSARDLARDVRRYLAGEPIEAKRDSVTYVLRKQLRRHRVAVAVASGFVVLLAAGLVASVWLWRSSEYHRGVAVVNLGRATAAETEARQEAQRAEKVTRLITAIFQGADPKQGGDHSLSALQVLDRGADRILAELADEPITRADLLAALGEIYCHLGAFDRGRGYLREALDLYSAHAGPASHGLIETAFRLGEYDHNAGDDAAAAVHYGRSYEAISRTLSPENWHVIDALARTLISQERYADAEPILRDGLNYLRESRAAKPVLLGWLNMYGQTLDARQKYAEAVPVMRESVALSDNLPAYLWEFRPATQNNLAWLLLNTGELEEAAALAEESLRARKERLPADHLDVASSLYVLGSVRLKQGDRAAAAPMLRESLRIRAAMLPAEDERVTDARARLSECGQTDAAPPSPTP